MSQNYENFRKDFLINHTLPNGIFAEDLDDFCDAVVGGMASSIIVLVDGTPNQLSSDGPCFSVH
jgi:hypothetical protein